jgi:3-hydroxyisobutyrate dehydrogenase
MMLKDLKLAQNAAKVAGADTPLGADAANIYEQFVEAGEGPRDFSAVIRFIRGG